MTERLAIAFHGAARTVTGSRHLITFGDRRMLFDCGLFQGHREEADALNRTFHFAPGEVDVAVISHAHLDHVGNVPTLFDQGFRGPLYGTAGTAALARIMLTDSAFLMQKDVERVNRRRDKRGDSSPARQPLYGPEDVTAALSRFETHDYHAPFAPLDGVEARFFDAGHILGSALTTLEFHAGGRTFRLGMGGDLGRPARQILRDPETHPGVDTLVLASTYGDRIHPDGPETMTALVEIIRRTVERGGRVLVPAFAVGRTQELVADLHQLIGQGLLPAVPMFVDSPMARAATGVYRGHPQYFDEPTRKAFDLGGGAPFGFDRLTYVTSPEESRALNDFDSPCILIAASGMCEGGRILHHLRHGLGNPNNTVLFVGFQAEGTLGRRLRDGAEKVNVFGEPVMVRAEIAALDGFSAHADQRELLAWTKSLVPAPKRIFLVHGELAPMETLAGLLRSEIGCEVTIPSRGEEFPLWT